MADNGWRVLRCEVGWFREGAAPVILLHGWAGDWEGGGGAERKNNVMQNGRFYKICIL